MEERDAIARLKQGDIGGLEILVRTYQVQAECAAYLITRDHALAEDIVQTAFLRAYERISQFDANRPFRPWFLRSVVNDAIKATIGRERQVSLDRITSSETDSGTELATDKEYDSAHLFEQVETREAVWAALGKLSPAQRSVIVQRYYLGMSEAEMSNNLNSSPGTVKSRLHVARERLRCLLLPLDSTGPRAEPRD
jgi:RNA polymerase sigma-70 factor (ECF subfamily)